MIKTIIEHFDKLNEQYAMLVDIVEEKFQLIKVKTDIQTVENLQKKEMEKAKDLLAARNELVTRVVAACEKEGLEDKRIGSLLRLMSVSEKEKIMACEKNAYIFDTKLKNSLKNTERLVSAMREVPKILIETYRHLMSEETGGAQTILNKKF